MSGLLTHLDDLAVLVETGPKQLFEELKEWALLYGLFALAGMMVYTPFWFVWSLAPSPLRLAAWFVRTGGWLVVLVLFLYLLSLVAWLVVKLIKLAKLLFR